MSKYLKSLLQENVVNEAEVDECASAVAAGDVKLSTIVADLGPLLTDSNIEKRKCGLECLSGLIGKVQPDSLGAEEVKLLCSFYQDRAKDSPLTYSAIVVGLHNIVTVTVRDNLKDDNVIVILRTCLNELHPQSLPVLDRQMIFDIISWCLENKLKVLKRKDFSSQFVLGFIQAVEGETSPRNLIQIFSCWPIIIHHLDCQMFIEDIFEALACYFPVDFAPAKGSLVKITRTDLAHGLKRCIAATSSFAPFAIPLFLEKLSSDVMAAKSDAVEYFIECLKSYEPTQLKDHLKEVWNSCKQEIMGIRDTSNPRVKEETLNLLEAFTVCLCRATQTAENIIIRNSWTELILADMKPFLKFIESNLMESAAGILMKVSSADKLMSAPVLDLAMPTLMDLCESSTDQKSRAASLMAAFLLAGHPFGSTPEWAPRFLKVSELGCYSKNAEWRQASLTGLIHGSLKLKYSLIEDFLVEMFNAGTRSEFEMTEKEMVLLTLHLSKVRQDIITSWIETLLPISKANVGRLKPLEALCCEHDSSSLTEKIISELVQAVKEKREGCSEKCMEFLNNILAREEKLDLVLNQGIIGALIEAGKGDNGWDVETTLCYIISKLYGDDHASFVKPLMEASVSNHKSSYIFSSLCCLHPSLIELLDLGSNFFVEGFPETEPIMRLRGSLLNKRPSLETTNYMASLLKDCQSYQNNLHWIIKGLITRGSKMANKLIKSYVIQLKERRADENFVQNFISVYNADQSYKKEHHHTVMPFYKQKFFCLTFPTMVSWFEEDPSNSDVQELILLQLPLVPVSSVKNEIQPILPRLTRALFTKDPEKGLSRATSNFLTFIRQVEPEMLNSLIDVIVPFLLNVTQVTKGSMEDRISALNILETLANKRISPSIQTVIVKETVPLLSDKKRLVRRAAVDARNAWLVI